ncbi:DNA internalization-related competence protein ComEC/Rec2 [Ramlibacter solisilvae]|uniref:Competence protein ComEC n=1 Tax=Ramlibacter tataouinensis TaxID=94132 RepID=A0A127JPG6_9BURK|nr:DNA internalization-related competence protein ComEC/Rec2 [Ramlibacter tataouinensis]AMO21880.1 competence protein ComEC [Ramlibacter tataouinensis]
MRTHTPAAALLTPALAGFVAGTALQLQQPALDDGLLYAAVAALGLLMACSIALVHSRPLAGAALFAGVAALAFSLCGARALDIQARGLAAELEGRELTVTGVVAAMPQRGDTGVRFRFEVESATLEREAVRLPPQLYLGWYAGPADAGAAPPDLRAGERWRLQVRLKAPHGHQNPHGFDYELWLWEQGMQATGYVRAGPRNAAPQRLAQTWRHPVELARQSVRDAVLRQVADRKTAGILAALIVGDQNAIERADWDIFRATGVAHLMSISGLHITMFAWAAALAVGALWRRGQRLCLAVPAQHAALLGGLGIAWAYALFSGWGVPAQRTIWMLAAVSALRLAGRRWPWPQVWLMACALVLALDPWAMLQAGFWLSFVAVGVLFAADPGAQAPPARSRLRQAVDRLRAALHEQWVVTLALTPMALLLFGQVSVVGLPANALAIPWVTLVVTPLALAGVAFNGLWALAAAALQGLQVWLEWLASLPFATVSLPAAPLWAGVAGVTGGLLLAMRLPWHARLLGVPLLLPVLLWQGVRPPAGEFELLAADVGQGNAVIVRTAGHTLVYDAGPRWGPDSDAGHRVLVPLLRAFDERVDILMLSHRDTDHTGGAAAVLSMQPQAALVSSLEDGHPLLAWPASTRCTGGQRWRWDAVDFELLHPAAADYGAAARPNALSCVLRVSNGQRSALLPGDVEARQEAQLVASGAPLSADLLLVPHHGSKTSSSADFLDAVHPSLALVQAGWRNRFGHPAPVVLERLRERGIAVIDSPHCGAAGWRSWQPGQVTCERELRPRYWRHPVP